MNTLAPTGIRNVVPKSAAERRRQRAALQLLAERQEHERVYFEMKAVFDGLKHERQVEVADRNPQALMHFCLKPHTIQNLGPAQLVQWAMGGASFRLIPQRNPLDGRLQVRVSDGATNRWLCVWEYADFWRLDRWLDGDGR